MFTCSTLLKGLIF